jgi:hypothetical protein
LGLGRTREKKIRVRHLGNVGPPSVSGGFNNTRLSSEEAVQASLGKPPSAGSKLLRVMKRPDLITVFLFVLTKERR